MSVPLSIGIDLVEIARIRKDTTLHVGFLERFLSKEEIHRYKGMDDPVPHYCGLLALKESVIKTLGTVHEDGILFRQIHISNHPPSVKLSGRAKEIADLKGIDDILVSVSHEGNVVVGVAIAMGKG